VGGFKSVGTRALKYGPQAALVWKYAAAPVTAAAQRAFATRTNRRTALKHAETVNEGAILMVLDQGETYWVVFSGGEAVASYPKAPGRVSDLIAHANLSKLMTPDQFRSRELQASRRQKALDVARTMSTQLRRRDDEF
jgi:hypothetical protein